LIAIGTEVGSIELYNMKVILKAEQRGQAAEPAPQQSD
jgi:hypothetical protein